MEFLKFTKICIPENFEFPVVISGITYAYVVLYTVYGLNYFEISKS